MKHTLPGLTLKQFAARRFAAALQNYREALASGNASKIVRASLHAHAACRDKRDRATLNRSAKTR